MAPSQVLVPLDGSPLAEEALIHALETYDCRVAVLNVVSPLDAGMSEGGPIELGRSPSASERERAAEVVTRAMAQVSASADRIETIVETGDPAEVILEYVDAHDVDLVVMGGHGGDRNELSRRLLGTVATAVTSEAPVTVTVVR